MRLVNDWITAQQTHTMSFVARHKCADKKPCFQNNLYILFFSSFVSEILWRPSTKMFKYSSMVMNTKKQIWTKTWLVVVLASSSRHCNMFIVHEFCGQYIFSLAKTQMLLNCHKIFKCVKSNAIRSFVDRKMLKRKCAIVWFWSQT